jgi:hypothetical protein
MTIGVAASLKSAVRAACHVGHASQQALLGARIGSDIKELLHIGGDGLLAARTGDLCLRHIA